MYIYIYIYIHTLLNPKEGTAMETRCRVEGLRVWDLGFTGFDFRLWGLGFGVEGFGFRV